MRPAIQTVKKFLNEYDSIPLLEYLDELAVVDFEWFKKKRAQEAFELACRAAQFDVALKLTEHGLIPTPENLVLSRDLFAMVYVTIQEHRDIDAPIVLFKKKKLDFDDLDEKTKNHFKTPDGYGIRTTPTVKSPQELSQFFFNDKTLPFSLESCQSLWECGAIKDLDFLDFSRLLPVSRELLVDIIGSKSEEIKEETYLTENEIRDVFRSLLSLVPAEKADTTKALIWKQSIQAMHDTSYVSRFQLLYWNALVEATTFGLNNNHLNDTFTTVTEWNRLDWFAAFYAKSGWVGKEEVSDEYMELISPEFIHYKTHLGLEGYGFDPESNGMVLLQKVLEHTLVEVSTSLVSDKRFASKENALPVISGIKILHEMVEKALSGVEKGWWSQQSHEDLVKSMSVFERHHFKSENPVAQEIVENFIALWNNRLLEKRIMKASPSTPQIKMDRF